MAKENGVDRVFVHAFMDGRDTLPTNGVGYLELLQQKMREYGTGKIAISQWPLLRHGPRSPLGSHRQNLQRHGLWRRRRRQVCRSGSGSERFLQQGRDR